MYKAYIKDSVVVCCVPVNTDGYTLTYNGESDRTVNTDENIPLFSSFIEDELPEDAPEGTQPTYSFGPVIQQYRKNVSRIEFKSLFTIAERVAIAQARNYSGTNSTQLIMKYALDAFYEVLEDPQLAYIDMGSATILEGLTYCVQGGLLTEQRKEVILKGVAI